MKISSEGTSRTAAHRFPSRIRRRSLLRTGVVLAGILLAGPAPGQLAQTFFVPVDETHVRDLAFAVTGAAGDTTHAVVSLSATADGTTVYYDHWEDGYEVDLQNPVQPTTETFLLDAGDFLALEDDIDLAPRDPAIIEYDGRDRIGTTEQIAVTRAGWRLAEATLLAGAVEVFPTLDWGKTFEFPLGENIVSSQTYEYVAASIMAGETGAVFDIDTDGDGIADSTPTLGPGESLLVTNIQTGGSINSSDPLQVTLLTGDLGSTFASRWFGLVPIESWGSSYYSPVSSVISSENRIFLYNPGSASIAVSHETLVPTLSTRTYDNTTAGVISFAGTPCSSPLVRTFSVPDSFDVHEARLGFNATHPYRGDIEATLVAPSGASGVVLAAEGSDGDANFDLLLSDSSSNPVDDGGADNTASPFYDRTAGTTLSGLALFAGESANGTWTLRICDTFTDDSGTFNRAQLRLIEKTGTTFTAGTVSVPAGGITEFTVPVDSAAHFFTAGGETFFGTAAVDWNDTSSDWGFTLLPSDALATTIVAGWAPGRDPSSATNPTENGSPIWVTATAATDLYVDFDGDPTTGALVDANGNRYDQLISVGALESTRLFDPTDTDQSGTRVYTLDGTSIAAAWGQDATSASPGAPAIDVGTTVLPLDALRAFKEGTLLDDADGDGALGPGDTMEYRILIANVSEAVVTGAVLEDFGLDPNLTYVADSTEIDGVAVADDLAGTTLFPLDEGGQPLATIGIGETVDVTFAVVIANPLPAGVEELINQVRVTTGTQTEVGSTSTTIRNPALAITKVSNAVGDVVAGQTIEYTVTVDNISGGAARGIKVLDALPEGTAYDAETTVATGFVDVFDGTLTVTDEPAGGTAVGGSTACGTQDAVRTFSVARSMTLTDVTFGLNANHFYRGDIRGTLQSPTGTVVELLSANAGDSRDNYDLLLDDASTNPIDDGGPDNTAAPFYDRTAAPSNPLSAFDGENAAGTWTLRLCDTFPGADDGTYNRSELRLTGTGSTAASKTNQAAAASPLLQGDPTNLVLAPDGFGLLAGQSMTVTYRVVVEDPLVFGTTAISNTASVTSLEQVEPLLSTVVDPVSRGAAIGDRVWLDTDGDGFQDVGEPGLANVLVELYDPGGDGVPGGGDDILVATTRTDADGRYLFDLLPAGSYYVDVDGSTIPSGLAPSPGTSDPSAVVTVAAEETRDDLDFGYANASAATAIVGDYLWSDADGDGVQDPGEPGIGGVSVELLDASGTVITTVTTADDGSYLFTGVAPGEYRIRVAASNFTAGNSLDGYTVTSGPQSEGSDTSSPVTLSAGEVVTDVDFGYLDAAGTYSISNTVWLDADSDGYLDAGAAPEGGIAGVTVDLRDASGDIIATTVTAADGTFSFDGVTSGSYTVSISDNGGRLLGLAGTTAEGSARSLAVEVIAADLSGVDFGYNGKALLGDRVWSDADGDGVQDPNEPGLAGVTVELLDRAGAVIATTTTDAFGRYVFDGISPDRYTVRVDAATLPGGFVQTSDPDATFDDQSSSLLALGDADLGLDFGYRNPARPDISGNVFSDLDLDGVDDGAGEPGFASVTVALLDSAGTTIATTFTDANGDYSFADLPAGDYSVSVTDALGVLADHQITSGLDTLSVTVAGSDVTGLDFGYARDSATGSIGDRVWLDSDGDGVQDGAETGLGGVTVELYDPGPDGVAGGGDDVLLATAVTDANGQYVFAGLAAGSYYAQLDTSSLPGAGAGLVITTPNPTAPILLSEGEAFREADFGVGSAVATGAIGDRVWFDADGDGVQDPGEAGIAGVDILLFGPGCAPCTTTTGADGSYLFTGLAAGEYDVDYDPATLPAAYDPSPTNTDGPWNVDDLAGGVLVTNADFGFPAAGAVASIGDLVFLDLDGDGVRDVGEPGIEGVTIDLLDATGTTVLASTTTAADGTYTFSGLAAGTYRVRVSDTANVLSGLNLSAGTNPTASISLAAGTSYTDADFPYAPSGGTGSIGNLVWHDTNGDGDRDPGESGIEGVTIELWRDVDGNGLIEPGTDNLVRTTSTDRNGEYVFNGLPAGNYLVNPTDEAGVLDGFTLTSGSADTNDHSQSDPYPVTVGSGSVQTADFGYHAGSGADILGTVFFDVDANGSEDPVDFGIEQVEVFLYRDLDGDGVLDPGEPRIGVTTVDAMGDYVFEDLPPGDYVVTVDAGGTFVDGATQTTQILTNSVEPVTLLAVDSVDNDFGFNRRATLALVTGVHARQGPRGARLYWQTAAEAGTAGFRVHRVDGGEPESISAFVPAPVGAPQGGSYAVDLDDVGGSGSFSIYLEEVERGGGTRLHGPYGLELGATTAELAASGLELEGPALSGPADSVARAPDAHSRDRLEAARAEVRQRQAEGRYGVARESARAAGKTAETSARLRLEVTSDGLYFVPAATIAVALGLDEALVRSRLGALEFRLERVGRPVAYLPAIGPHTGAETSTVSGIYFLGHAVDDDLYTETEVYWLAPGQGMAMPAVEGGLVPPAEVSVLAQTLHSEEDAFAATFVARDPELDYWHWRGLIAGHGTHGSTDLVLRAPEHEAGTGGRLAVALRGAGRTAVPDEHHAVFEIDGLRVGETRFDDYDDHVAYLDLPPGSFADGSTLRIGALLDTGAFQSFFYLDSVDLEYRRRARSEGGSFAADFGDLEAITVETFVGEGAAAGDVLVLDTSQPDRPRRIVDAWTSLAPGMVDGTLRTGFGRPANATRFRVESLASAREPYLEPVASSDLRHPTSAGRYLVLAPAALAEPAERLAQLRGATFGTTRVVLLEEIWDELAHGRFHPPAIRDFLAWAVDHWADPPTHVALLGKGHFDYRELHQERLPGVPPVLVGTPFGLYSSDTWLADFDLDGRPDLALGRIPAQSTAEADAYIDKLIAFEAEAGPWVHSAFLMADNDDLGGDFGREIAEVASLVSPEAEVEVAYLEQDGNDGLRARLQAATARGVGLVDWMGHGGLDRLGDEGVLDNALASSLEVGGRPPLFALLSCNVGRYEVPGFTSLAETLVLAEGGAIAVLAPSGLALDVDNFAANRRLVETLFGGEQETLGEVMRSVIGDLARVARLDSAPQIYMLLGDPGLPTVWNGLPSATLLVDGFESGTVAAWSSSVP